ncbi:flagellar hook assembly protein FlgD [Caulobacter sp. NIBR2454]|uniref:flagellar hook assembly protein FlgD n=1 Tax=Caulobacter sp. NIBR2454 TaxID=3015996 RepID=UPI0022B627FE|nr:flagellar hook capping FlgD N-terminal domain-containing protein [Caulobacter sp. NIBR2454]
MVDAVSGSTIAGRQQNSRNTLASSQETFLALLTTQLKNQDPLAPVDSTQFVTQTVQMVGVEQQLMTNDLLTALVGMNDGGLNESASLLGKTVIAENATQKIGDDGKATWSYDLAGDAKYTKLEIVNSAGNIVKTIEPEGAAANKKGSHSYTWDGVLSVADDGTKTYAKKGAAYTIRVKATSATGGAVETSTDLTGVATSVAIEGGQSVLTINGLKIPLSSVIGVTNPKPPADDDATT